MMSSSPDSSLFSCLLCGGILPSTLDDVFLAHMNDQHRAYLNTQFFYSACFLDGESLAKTIQFMESLRTGVGEESTADALISQEPIEEDVNNMNEGEMHEEMENNIEKNRSYCKDERIENITDDTKKVLGAVNDVVAKDKTCDLKATHRCKCKITWKSRKEKSYHIKTEHRKYFNCETCMKAFKEEKNYSSHLQNHANKIKGESNICEDCGFVGKDKYSVKSHRNFHHDDTVLICDICSTDFQGHLRLKIHRRRSHANSNKNCTECGGVFKNLPKHIKTMHTSENDKKYQCDKCGKGFVDKTRLASHTISVHTSEKPFACRFKCGFACSSAGNRTKHEFKHNTQSKVKTEVAVDC